MVKQRLVGLMVAVTMMFAVFWGAVHAQEATEEPMGGDAMGMEMDSGYSVDKLAPMAMAYYDDTVVYFVHPEASDKGVAEILTKMMGPDVLTVPSLAKIPAELLGNAFVFTNGVDGMGPLGFQPDVFDSVPDDETYTPLRALNLVTWQDGSKPRELKSVKAIQDAVQAKEVVIEKPGVVVNMPILVWGDQTR